MASEEAVYQPKDAVTMAIRSTMITGGAGAVVSSVQNTLTKQNVTAWGIFTRTGGTIAVFGSLFKPQLAIGVADHKNSCNGRNLRIRKACFGEP